MNKYQVRVVKTMYFDVMAESPEDAEEFVRHDGGEDWEQYEYDVALDFEVADTVRNDTGPFWA